MSFNFLQDISSLVTNNTKIPPFSEAGEESKYLRLIAGIQENRWKNDAEAEQELYGKELNIKTFEMLKTRAKEHLVNMIFQLDTQKKFKSSYDRAYYKCCKNLMAGVILLLQNKQKIGLNHLNLANRVAEKHHLTDLQVVSLRQLRYYASFSLSVKKFKDINLKLKHLLNIQLAELKCEEFDQELIIDTASSITQSTQFSEKAGNYYKNVKEIFTKHPTHSIRLSMVRIGLRYYDSIKKYQNVISLANGYIEYLNHNPHLLQRVRLGEMNLHKLNASLQLRDYKQGTKIAEECGSLFNPGSLNWLVYLETYFMLCLQTGEYSKALSIYKDVITHPAFNTYPSGRKEQWRLYEAYLNYAHTGSITNAKKFNVFKFVNEVPLYSKDKAGYNISILVAQIILLLKVADYDKIISRNESLKLYISRHVKRENSPRTYYFLKMLLVMIKYDFNPDKTKKIAQKFFDRMQEKGVNSEIEEMEIIPYDILWSQVLNMLEKQKHEHIFIKN
jgi:hypothetical protein